MKSQIDLNNSTKQLNDAKAAWENMSRYERINLIKQQARAAGYQGDLSYAQAERINKLVDQELENMKLEGKVMEADNFFGIAGIDNLDSGSFFGGVSGALQIFAHVLSHMLRFSR